MECYSAPTRDGPFISACLLWYVCCSVSLQNGDWLPTTFCRLTIEITDENTHRPMGGLVGNPPAPFESPSSVAGSEKSRHMVEPSPALFFSMLDRHGERCLLSLRGGSSCSPWALMRPCSWSAQRGKGRLLPKKTGQLLLAGSSVLPRSAPLRSAPLRFVLVRAALLRLAPLRSVSLRLAPLRVVSLRLAR
jgi:hypothetical protein